MATKDLISCIYDDLISHLEKIPSIKCLRNLRFGLDKPPDYNSLLIQRIYLLRYLYAYICEYYKAYNAMYELTGGEFGTQYINVLSVGCGAKLDYIALRRLLNEKQGKNVQAISYTGVDKVQWYSPFKQIRNDRIRIETQNFRTWLYENYYKFSHSDIIIFPKSIGEFEENDFFDVCNKLRNDVWKITKKRVVIIGSFQQRKDKRDIARFDRIVARIRETGGFIEKNSRVHCGSESDFVKLEQVIDDSIPYPERVIEGLQNLYQSCNEYKKTGRCCDDRCESVKVFRNPITTTKYFDYKVVILEKETI